MEAEEFKHFIFTFAAPVQRFEPQFCLKKKSIHSKAFKNCKISFFFLSFAR